MQLFVPVVIFAYPVLQLAALYYGRGAVRRLSLLPLPVAIWLFWGWIQFRQGAPNTNLYPLLPIFLCPLMDLYLIACLSAAGVQKKRLPVGSSSQ
jgi:hypothetical protein